MEDWLRPLLGSLRLDRPDGTLLLVRHAPPHRLPVLLRALLPEFPDLLVLHRLQELAAVPEGALVVFLPDLDELDALNLHRPLLARRRLRVVLWCDEETGAQLRIRAPDLADWVLRGVDCAPAPPPWAVAGLQALQASGVAGCLWEGEGHEEALRAADLGAVTHLSAARSYEVLLREIRAAPPGPLCFTQVDSGVRLRRLRWALAQAHRAGPALVVPDRIERPGGAPSSRASSLGWAANGWWRLPGRGAAEEMIVIRDNPPFGESGPFTPDLATPRSLQIVNLSPVMSSAPATACRFGLLAGLLGFEVAAVELCVALIGAELSEEELLGHLLAAADPGAEVARLAMARGLISAENVALGTASLPLLRGLWGDDRVQALREVWRAEPSGPPDHAGAAAAHEPWRDPAVPPDEARARSAWYRAEPLLRGVHLSRMPEDAPERRWLVTCAEGAWDRRVASAWAGRRVRVPRPPRPRGPWDEESAEQALRQVKESLGPEHPRVADWLEQVEEARQVSAKLPLFARVRSQHVDTCERVLAIREESQGPEHPDTARAAAALAEALISHGYLKGAGQEPEALQRRALDIWARTPALAYERAAVLASQARALRGRLQESMERLRQAAVELRRSPGQGSGLRVLGLWPPRYLSLDPIVEMITLLSRLRRHWEDGPLAGAVTLDALLLAEDWARPALLDPQVVIYGGDWTATVAEPDGSFRTADPQLVLLAKLAPEEFNRQMAQRRHGEPVHFYSEELLALLPRLQASVRCLCLPAPQKLDLPFFQRHLAGRVGALLLLPRGWAHRSARTALALARFCEALVDGAVDLEDALSRASEGIPGEADLRLVRL